MQKYVFLKLDLMVKRQYFRYKEYFCLSSLLDTYAPPKTRIITVRSNSPWYCEETSEAKREHRRLERKWRKSKLEIDHQLYRKQRNLVNRLLRQCKQNHFSSLIQNCAKDQKQLFRVTDQLLHRKKKKKKKKKNNHYLNVIHMSILLMSFAPFSVTRLEQFATALLTIHVRYRIYHLIRMTPTSLHLNVLRKMKY